MEEPRFPYTVKRSLASLNDGICCHTVSIDSWHTRRCNKKLKQTLDGIGLCGIHARSVLNWRKQ
jgi:hypothetical protein